MAPPGSSWHVSAGSILHGECTFDVKEQGTDHLLLPPGILEKCGDIVEGV